MVSRAAIAKLRLTAAACVLALLGGAIIAQPASANGGDANTEGYVLIQQALGHLFHDTGPVGTDEALMKVSELLNAEDQHGVAVDEVRQAKTALEAGKIVEARTLLQGSIAEAVAALKPATGDETGTTIVLGPLPPRGPLTGWDWAFLLLSALAALLGAVLAVLFRPRDSLRELRHTLSLHRAASPSPSERHRRGRARDDK